MAGPYAQLPGTGSGAPVRHNVTTMKSAARREVPGCHPSRWIYELLNNNFTTCDLFDRALHAGAALDAPFGWQHQHRLVLNGNQSFATSDRKVLSSICLDCHFHFVFKMTWDPEHAHETCSPTQAVWPMREDAHPWHHLVWAGSALEGALRDETERSAYYPLLAREHFICLCAPCTFQLTLDVSEPRLRTEHIKLLQDEKAILEALRKAREEEPQRYEGATDEWAKQAPQNLNTYLKNVLESNDESMRPISKRNKRFAVVFGPRCFHLFGHILEFHETQDIRDGIDEGYFLPAKPDPPLSVTGETEIGTYRSYLEDIRTEVQCLIHKAGQSGESPSFINTALHADLGCKEVRVSHDPLVNLERYKLLGILPGQPREVVVNAYLRQWELSPSKKKLIEALMAVANDCGDQDLSDYAITQSSVFDSQQVVHNTDEDGLVNQALIYLDLSPPNTYTPQSIIEAFRQKLVQQPAGASTARAMLMLVAQASNDDSYQAALVVEADHRMTLETAKTVLGVKGSEITMGEELLEAAKLKLKGAKTRDERILYIQALESIRTWWGAEDLDVEIDILRDDYDTRPPIDFDSTDASGSQQQRAEDPSLPVGLDNIGNTCYLNSLLQYLFTVKAVRDIVMNYNTFKLDITEDSIKQRRIGGNKMQMDRGEAVVAQAFVHELADLFRMLYKSDRIATRPSQRLANAVLLSTRSLLDNSKNGQDATAAPKPPPLPARPVPAPEPDPNQLPDDTGMAVDPSSTTREQHTSSRGSSATLVDANDDLPSYEEVERLPAVADEGQPDQRAKHQAKVDNGEPAEQEKQATDADIVMTDIVDEPENIDRKVLSALEHQKRSSGTDQQDVDEVIGSIISRLQAAIRPSHIDADTGIQFEKLIDTFFVTTVNYTKKFDENTYQHEISYDRSITAFPAPDGSCSLHEALARNFDQQVLDESRLSRYTAIKSLPPILHVLIQRTQSTGRKNDNAVSIPETLYLDRYVDAPHDSPEFQRRTEDWALTSRLADLKRHKLETPELGGAGSALDAISDTMRKSCEDDDALAILDNGDGAMAVDRENTGNFLLPQDEDWSFDGPIEDGFISISRKCPANGDAKEQCPDPPSGFQEAEETVRCMVDDELAQHEMTLQGHFGSSKKHAYRLEAVICHRGRLSAGHYWVWIHDFEENIWRCYNDAKVEVEADTEKVLDRLSKGGEPYYLCYVRDADKEDWVNVPKREVEQPTEDQAMTTVTEDQEVDW